MDDPGSFIRASLLYHRILCIISAFATTFTILIILKHTPVKSRPYMRYLIALLYLSILSPIIFTATDDTAALCFVSAPIIQLGSRLQELFGLSDPVFSLRFSLITGLLVAATNPAAYAHAVLYRHQISIDPRSICLMPTTLLRGAFAACYLVVASSGLYLMATVGMLDFKAADFHPASLKNVVQKELAAMCTDRLKVEWGWTLLGGVCFGFCCLLTLAGHSYYSLVSRNILHKKVREMSKILVFSMACQFVFGYKILDIFERIFAPKPEYPTWAYCFGIAIILFQFSPFIFFAIRNIIKASEKGEPIRSLLRVQPDHPSYKRIMALNAAQTPTGESQIESPSGVQKADKSTNVNLSQKSASKSGSG
ncbi:unnamed protein product, partial [Mesorhabditis spiculigera]